MPRPLTEDLSMDSNAGVLVLNDPADLEFVERRCDPADRRRDPADRRRASWTSPTPAWRHWSERWSRTETSRDENVSGLSDWERVTFRQLSVKALENILQPGGSLRGCAEKIEWLGRGAGP